MNLQHLLPSLRHDAGRLRRRALILALALPALLVQDAAAQPRAERDGLVLYWGLVPAAVASDKHALDEMHGVVPANATRVHHLVVALFDKTSGKRIADAVVRAQINEVGIVESAPKYLTPMPVNGLSSYGHLFGTVKEGPYHVRILVKPPGRPQEIEFNLTGQSPHPAAR